MRQRTKWNALFSGRTPREIFSSIYENSVWGDNQPGKYYSGLGSHDPQIVEPYLSSVSDFLKHLTTKPNAVDLGCGDFNVGKRIRPFCDRYIACDIVPKLIDRNRTSFGELDVDFKCLDMSEDSLPDGDIVFLRQVLQHMSNDQIAKLTPNLRKYRWAIVTESLPVDPNFKPNLDISAGPGIRICRGILEDSGVILTAPPFSLQTVSEQILCEVRIPHVLIRTYLYEMNRATER